MCCDQQAWLSCSKLPFSPQTRACAAGEGPAQRSGRKLGQLMSRPAVRAPQADEAPSLPFPSPMGTQAEERRERGDPRLEDPPQSHRGAGRASRLCLSPAPGGAQVS